MENQITIREAITEQDLTFFWEQVRIYHKQDIFSNPEDQDKVYFSEDAHSRVKLERIGGQEQERLHCLLFYRGEQKIGFALSVIHHAEDESCFLMEFCTFPEFCGDDTGSQCARELIAWAHEKEAQYLEIHCSTTQQQRFWQQFGFVLNGVNERGVPLMILPLKEEIPIRIEILADPENEQFKKLENGFLREIEESPLTGKQQTQLAKAIRDGKITFFIAKRSHRMIGMCSVARCFSTFACSDTGVFEDFYIEPAFRGKGIARKLAQAAQSWCKTNNLSSLTVCSAPCDEQMYQNFGFTISLGHTYAHLI